MEINKDRIQRLKIKNRPKFHVAVTVDSKNLEVAKKFCKKNEMTLSSLFDVALEDLLYSILNESEQDSIYESISEKGERALFNKSK